KSALSALKKTEQDLEIFKQTSKSADAYEREIEQQSKAIAEYQALKAAAVEEKQQLGAEQAKLQGQQLTLLRPVATIPFDTATAERGETLIANRLQTDVTILPKPETSPLGVEEEKQKIDKATFVAEETKRELRAN